MIFKEKIKELRKRLKQINYKLKTKSVTFTNNKVFANIYLNNEFIFGDNGNVYSEEIFIKHKKAIEIFKEYKA